MDLRVNENLKHLGGGIEVGNIFQSGAKYTKAMGMEYLDETEEEINRLA